MGISEIDLKLNYQLKRFEIKYHKNLENMLVYKVEHFSRTILYIYIHIYLYLGDIATVVDVDNMEDVIV